jgi:hypothetical protein
MVLCHELKTYNIKIVHSVYAVMVPKHFLYLAGQSFFLLNCLLKNELTYQ